MTALAKRITDLRESATIKMAQLSRELKQQGKDIIDLSLGEPDFDTPEHIRESAKKAIDDGFSHYTAVNGIVELREAVCHKFKRDNNLDYEPDQIVVSTGAKQSLANLMLCLVNPGDEVILPCPYWVSYQSMVEIAQGTVVTIPTTVESRFKITAEQLEDTITSKSKILVINLSLIHI